MSNTVVQILPVCKVRDENGLHSLTKYLLGKGTVLGHSNAVYDSVEGDRY